MVAKPVNVNTEVGIIERGAGGRFMVSFVCWKDKDYVDIREQYFDEGKQEWFSTRKGVRLLVSALPELYTLLNKAVMGE